MAKHIGILTSGGDCPGLNPAIRGIGKTALSEHDMQIIGFRDGFRGLMENRFIRLDNTQLSGILTLGGTILGHLQRGGIPSAADRLLATRLGTACVDYISKGKYGILVAARGEQTEPVPLEKVVNKLKFVPPDHPWVISARNVGTCLGN